MHSTLSQKKPASKVYWIKKAEIKTENPLKFKIHCYPWLFKIHILIKHKQKLKAQRFSSMFFKFCLANKFVTDFSAALYEQKCAKAKYI